MDSIIIHPDIEIVFLLLYIIVDNHFTSQRHLKTPIQKPLTTLQYSDSVVHILILGSANN